MFQKLFPLRGDRPAEDIDRLLASVRARDTRYDVTFGAPPFQRNWCDQITGVRLRFTPRPTSAAASDRPAA